MIFIADTKKGERDEMGIALNSYHPNLKFTVEKEPEKFLDSEIQLNDGTYTFSLKVFHKPNIFPMHWSSQTPRRYKRNAIFCELHRAYMILDCFEEDIIKIRERFAHAGFPYGFVNEVIKNFRFSLFERIIPENISH